MSRGTSENQSILDRVTEDCMNFLYDVTELIDKKTKPGNIQKRVCDYLGKVHGKYGKIPDFDQDLDWFNVDHPLSFQNDLKDNIVVLDFFTYCCINCMHMLPVLKRIEHNFPVTDGVVVVGVHNAKFTNEKKSENVEAAIKRYEIEHPVVNDFRCGLWKKLDVHCWPTFMIIGPGLNPLFVLMGEFRYELFHEIIAGAKHFYQDRGLVKPISTFQLLKDNFKPASNLKFPGKIQCSRYSTEDRVPELYALSDSGNHRIIVFDEHGRVIHKIGGESGFVDGDFQQARFNAPQGVTFYNQYTLYVADNENHAIRKIDLRDKYVETVVGTGEQGTDLVGLKKGREQAISSPWDLIFLKTRDMELSVYLQDYEVPMKSICLIAMAGTHQIWAYFMEDTVWWRYKKYTAGQCVAIAGNGEERNRNNFYPNQASFAQPSGITYNKRTQEFYIADSESSSIRSVALKDGEVSAVVGGNINPMNLFAYGDVDGERYNAKLQHPLGVAYHYQPTSDKQVLFVADTYNHKIKRVDLETNVIQTMPIVDKNGELFAFNEPTDLCMTPSGEHLIIADTNNHRLVKVELFSFEASVFELNWNSPVESEEEILDGVLVAKACKVLTGSRSFKVRVNYSLLNDIHGTPGATNKCCSKYTTSEGTTETTSKVFMDANEGFTDINFKVKPEELFNGTVVSKSILFLCQYDTCFKREFELRIPIEVVDGPQQDNEYSVDVVITKYNIVLKKKQAADEQAQDSIETVKVRSFDPDSEL